MIAFTPLTRGVYLNVIGSSDRQNIFFLDRLEVDGYINIKIKNSRKRHDNRTNHRWSIAPRIVKTLINFRLDRDTVVFSRN